jgi:beta-lactamase superfamily II metal-dependent hydrolase
LDHPKADEVEVSLFGPSYGESIVIHAGHGVWFVIDSCTVPGTGKSRCIDYFEEIGVDIATAVKAVIVTHWDQDHIRGLSQLFDAAENADLVISGAVFCEDFITLIQLYRDSGFGRGGGVQEFAKVLEILKKRNKKPKLVVEQTTIWNRDKDGTEEACLVALTPSSATVIDGHLHLHELLRTSQTQNLRLIETNRNDRSIVLWLKIGSAVALFGSDLEEVGDNNRGWSAVLLSSVGRSKSQLFKVPHHGSETAHEDRVWSDLLVPKPPAILAPWRRGATALPTVEDVQRLQTKTDRLYVTTIPQNARKRRPAMVEALIRSAVKQIRLVDESLGHVRLRTKFSSRNPVWSAALFHGAKKIEGRMAKAFPKAGL